MRQLLPSLSLLLLPGCLAWHRQLFTEEERAWYRGDSRGLARGESEGLARTRGLASPAVEGAGLRSGQREQELEEELEEEQEWEQEINPRFRQLKTAPVGVWFR